MKKIGLMLFGMAFCLSVFAITGNAQWYENRRYEDRNWQNRRVYSQNWYYGNQRNRRLTPQEARRLARQRERLERTHKRYYADDGRLSYKERRKLQQRYQKYRRAVIRDRRDW